MSTPVSLSIKDQESEAAEYLLGIQRLISREPLGFAPFTSDSYDYLRFRYAMALTAGGHLRTDNRLRTLSSSCAFHKPDSTSSLLKNIISRGWSSFNVDPDLLSKCVKEISVKSQTRRSVLLCPHSSSLFLRLIPKDVFKAACSYLGTDKPWIEPPQILKSTSQPKNYEPTEIELSNRAFAFHRDIDSIINLKVFINLSSTKGGAHEYIQTSSRSSIRKNLKLFSGFCIDTISPTVFCANYI